MARSVAALQALLPVVVMVGLLLSIEAIVAAGWAPSTVAAPSQVLQTIVADRRNIWFHVEPTLLTASTGFLIATAASLLLGLIVYVFRRVEGAVLTVAAVLTSIPMIAIAPALTTLMGLSMTTRITLTAFICAFPMMIAVTQGVSTTSKSAQELFVVLAASPWQRFRLLAIPTALPYLFLGAKIAAPLSLLGALVAEWTGAEEGLGVYIITSMFGLQIAQLWASVFIACGLSMSAYGLVALFESLALSGQTAGGSGA